MRCETHIYMQTKKCLLQVLLLWPLGHVFMWVVYDQNPFSQRTHTYADEHTIDLTISACVDFSLLPCLFTLVAASFLLKLPRSLFVPSCAFFVTPPCPPLSGASDDGGISL